MNKTIRGVSSQQGKEAVHNPTYAASNTHDVTATPPSDTKRGETENENDYVDLRQSQVGRRSSYEKLIIKGKVQTASVTEHSRQVMKQGAEVFTPTVSYNRAVDLLNEFRIVVIRGPPVSGKTAIGHALLRHFKGKGHSPLVLQHCQDWRNHVGGDKKQIVLLDCPFGEVRVNKDRYLEWTTTLSSLGQFIADSVNCLVVITMPSHVLTQLDSLANAASYFEHIPVLDLSEVSLTIDEKEEMLKKYLALNKNTLDREELRDVIKSDVSGPAFPRCCEVYSQNDWQEDYVNLSLGRDIKREIFRNPAPAFIGFFRSLLQELGNWKDLVPLLVLVMSGSGDLIGQKEQTETKLRILGLDPKEVDVKALEHFAEILKDSILSKDSRTFKSRALCDAFAFALFETGSVQLLLNSCDVEFCVRYVQTEPKPSNRIMIIDATSEHYSNLLARVCYDLLNGNLVQMSQHPALQNDKFLADFDEFLRKNNCLKVLLSTQDPRHGLPLLYWSAWSDSGTLTRWCLTRAVCVEDGRQLRQAFLVACLFGEKANSPRLADMFEMLCLDETVLEDVVVDVTLPLPSAQDLVVEELRAKRRCVMSGKTLLSCGLSTQGDAEENASGTSTSTTTSRPEQSTSPAPGHPKQTNTSLTEGPSSTDTAGSLDPQQHASTARPAPDRSDSLPKDNTTSSRLSQISSCLSDLSCSTTSSGSYLTPISQRFSAYSTLWDISENEDAEIAVNESRPASLSAEFPEAVSSNVLRQENAFTLTSISTPGISTRAGRPLPTVPEKGRRMGTPIPPSIVKIVVVEDQDVIVLKPKCARWYTLLRLLSMCDVDQVNRDGYTLMHSAAFNGEINVAQFLLESGADIASRTPQGNTPLSKAVDRNQVRMAAFLLKWASQASVQLGTATTTRNEGNADHYLSRMLGTRNQRDLLRDAVLKKRCQMLWLLLSHGADPLGMDSDGKTLLDHAKTVKDNTEVVNLLTRYKARGGTGTTAPEEVNYDDTILKQKDGEEQKNKKPKGIKKLLSLNSPKP